MQYFGHDLLSTLGTAHSEMLDHTQQSVLLSTGTGEKLSGILAVRTCCNDVYSFGTRVQSCVVPVWYLCGTFSVSNFMLFIIVEVFIAGSC